MSSQVKRTRTEVRQVRRQKTGPSLRWTTARRYGVILADPPWRYGSSQLNGSAQNHYSTMALPDLCALPVAELAKQNCALFMWGTWPHVPSAMQLGEAWGFNYVTGFPWVKLEQGSSMQAMQPDLFTGEAPLRPMFGTGWWVRGCSEYVLIWHRGKPKLPSTQYLGLLGDALNIARNRTTCIRLRRRCRGLILNYLLENGVQGGMCLAMKLKSRLS